MGKQFPREARLLSKSSFGQVFGNPKRSADRYFTVLARANGLGHARLGLAISRKVSKSAVVRNRIKRLVRESFRHRRLKDLDLVVMARPAAAGQSNETLFRALHHHWRRLNRDVTPAIR